LKNSEKIPYYLENFSEVVFEIANNFLKNYEKSSDRFVKIFSPLSADTKADAP
jgi:hypothetical protein